MDDFPTRFADLLDGFARRVRAVTVDRLNRWIRKSALGMSALTLALLATIFLMLAIFGALAIPLGPDGAFGVLGAVALLVGIWLWYRRRKVS
ncbi:MAG: hypothetical protein ACT4OP_12500 [Actinomycetota bacterium]